MLRRQHGEHLLVGLFAQCQHLFFFLVWSQRAILPDGHPLLPHVLADLLKLLFLRVREVEFLGEHGHMLASGHAAAPLASVGLAALALITILSLLGTCSKRQKYG